MRVQELEEKDIKKYRGMAAILNYLAADQPDIAYAAKEVCSGMARPKKGDWKKECRTCKA